MKISTQKLCLNTSKPLYELFLNKFVDGFFTNLLMYLQIWEKYEEPKTVQIVEETERKTNYKRIVVTEVGAELDFWAQMVDAGRVFI